jgi:nucleoside-diphosphate-sugar epimerase
MKVFVTGATGFIGSHLVNLAHERGIEVVAHRRGPDSIPRVAMNKEPQWVDGPLSDVSEEALEGCKAVIHLAAHSANVPYDTLENCIEHNVNQPLKLFRICVDAGIKRFIVAGSCFAYGDSGARYEFIPVDAPLEPTQSYPTSKAEASRAFSDFALKEEVELLILRIFHVYGEGELATRFWPSLKVAAEKGEDFPMSEGKQVRDFVPVEFVAKTFIDSLGRNDLEPGKPVINNLGTGHPMSLRVFAEREWKEWDAKGQLLIGELPSRPEEVMRYVPEL